MQLICFPHAGGFSLYYSFLKEAKLSHVNRVLLFDYHRRPPGCADFGDYVEDAVHYVQQHASDEPCLLFGHSMGALVACECGFVLQNRLQRPPMMGANGRGPRPPHEGGMPPMGMGEGAPDGMRRPRMMDGAPKPESAEDML